MSMLIAMSPVGLNDSMSSDAPTSGLLSKISMHADDLLSARSFSAEMTGGSARRRSHTPG
jgi:hypothetical protein